MPMAITPLIPGDEDTKFMLSQLLLTILALAVPNGAKGPGFGFSGFSPPSPVQEVQFFDSRDRVDVEAVDAPRRCRVAISFWR